MMIFKGTLCMKGYNVISITKPIEAVNKKLIFGVTHTIFM